MRSILSDVSCENFHQDIIDWNMSYNVNELNHRKEIHQHLIKIQDYTIRLVSCNEHLLVTCWIVSLSQKPIFETNPVKY